MNLETKFCATDAGLTVVDGRVIEGYASVFGMEDRGRDVVAKGAYAVSLKALKDAGRSVKMLWQHDPSQPIGVWDEVREDGRGLWVKGRLLPGVARAEEAAALLEAGAIEGLSIGYRTKRATKSGGGRILDEIELWEVSLVTFPMLPEARVDQKGEDPAEHLRELAAAIEGARRDLRLRPEMT